MSMEKDKLITTDDAHKALAEMYPDFFKVQQNENGETQLISSNAYENAGQVQGDPLSVGAISAGLGAPIGMYQQRQLMKTPTSVSTPSSTATTQTSPIINSNAPFQNTATGNMPIESLPSRKIKGASGASNFVRAMGDVPEVIAQQAENMRKDNPRGGQFLMDQDTLNKRKIESIGEGGKRLYTMPNGTQLMLEPREIMEIELKEKQLQEAKAIEEKAKSKSLYNRVVNTGKLFNSLTNKVPILSTPLSTGLMGAEGQESANRFEQGDIPGGIISGVGALGSAVSLVPHKGVQTVGRVLSIASPLALGAYDKLRKQRE